MMKRFVLALMLLLISTALPSQVMASEVNDGVSAGSWDINANKAGKVTDGISDRPTYIASVSGQATTAAYILSIESSSGTGFKLARFCVNWSVATAAAAGTITIQRRTTASSGGTALTAEGTGTTAVTKMDPADGNFAGVARLGGTPGTAGAVLDQFGFTVGELGASTDDPTNVPFCYKYGENGGKMPTVPAGTANGLTINVTASGAGGLAAGAITAVVIFE